MARSGGRIGSPRNGDRRSSRIDEQLDVRDGLDRLARDPDPFGVFGDRHTPPTFILTARAPILTLSSILGQFSAQAFALLVVAACNIGGHAVAKAAKHSATKACSRPWPEGPQPDVIAEIARVVKPGVPVSLSSPLLCQRAFHVDRILADQRRSQFRQDGPLDFPAVTEPNTRQTLVGSNFDKCIRLIDMM